MVDVRMAFKTQLYGFVVALYPKVLFGVDMMLIYPSVFATSFAYSFFHKPLVSVPIDRQMYGSFNNFTRSGRIFDCFFQINRSNKQTSKFYTFAPPSPPNNDQRHNQPKETHNPATL